MLREGAGLKELFTKVTILEHMEGQTVKYSNREVTSCKVPKRFRVYVAQRGTMGLINYLLLTAN